MIEIELVNRFDSKEYQLIWPGNIIYLAYEKDMSYDRASEDMGHFLTLVYLHDGKVIAELYNTGDFKPIEELIERSKGALLAKGANAFINRNRARDIKIESDSLIYLDKYKVSLKN